MLRSSTDRFNVCPRGIPWVFDAWAGRDTCGSLKFKHIAGMRDAALDDVVWNWHLDSFCPVSLHLRLRPTKRLPQMHAYIKTPHGNTANPAYKPTKRTQTKHINTHRRKYPAEFSILEEPNPRCCPSGRWKEEHNPLACRPPNGPNNRSCQSLRTYGCLILIYPRDRGMVCQT